MITMTVGEFMAAYHALTKATEVEFKLPVAIGIAIAMDKYTKVLMVITKRHTKLYENYGEVVEGKRRVLPANVAVFDSEFRALQQEQITIDKMGLTLEEIKTSTKQDVAPNIIQAMLKFSGVLDG